MTVTREQLEQLRDLGNQQGGLESQQFKDYVNNKLGAGGYDKIVSGIRKLNNDIKSKIVNPPTQPLPLVQEPSQTQTQEPSQSTPVPTQEQPQVVNQPQAQPTQEPSQTQTQEPSQEAQNNNKPYIVNSIDEFRQNPDGTLEAVIGGEKFKWTIDNAGNFIKKSLGKVQTPEDKMQQDPNVMYNNIRAGIKLDKKTVDPGEYNNQLARNDRFNTNINKSPYEISQDISNGKIIVGSDDYNDLMRANPSLMQNAVKLSKLNSILTGGNKENESKVANTQKTISEIVTQMLTPSQIPDLKNAIAKDGEITTWNNELADKERQMKELKDQINNSKRDIEESLKGTGASRGYANALITDRTQKLSEAYNNLLNEYNYTANKISRKSENISYDIKAQQDTETQRQDRLKLAYGFAKDELSQLQANDKDIKDKLYNEYIRQEEKDYQKANNDLVYNRQVEKDKLDFNQQKELLKIQNDYKDKNIDTQLIKSGDKNILINTKTGETIKSFDLPKDTVKSEYSKLNNNTIYDSSSGNFKTVNTNGNTNLNTTNGDLSNTNLVSKYPNEASFKNNNPTGMTWGISDNLKNMFTEAGIDFGQGEKRPTNEGGSYIKFKTIEDGMKAYQIALTKGGSDDIYSRLKQWVGTSEGDNYANSIMSKVGISKGTKFSELSDQQLNDLMIIHLKRESPGLYKELTSGNNIQSDSLSEKAKYYVDLYNKGTLTLDKISSSLGTSKEAMPLKNEIIKQIQGQGGKQLLEKDNPIIKDTENIRDNIKDLLSEDNKDYMEDITGFLRMSPYDTMTGKKQDYLGKVQNLLDKGVLENYANAKQQGLTFGALSDSELSLLKSSSNLLLNRAERDKEGRITGFDMSDGLFREELEKLLGVFENKIKSFNIKKQDVIAPNGKIYKFE